MDSISHYERERARLIAGGAYRPEDERDACGVGFVAAIDGAASRRIVDMGIRALKAVWHRGAVDSDGKTGDGAGLRLALDNAFFKRKLEEMGVKPPEQALAVAQIFLPRTDLAAQSFARTIIEDELSRERFGFHGWRQVPVDPSVLGTKANRTRPEIAQAIFSDPQNRDVAALERALYLVRRRAEFRAREAAASLYVCSIGARDIVYKGMFLAEDVANFYPDLADPELTTHFAMFHQRYSTNTYPDWPLAQPFRLLAHNGEINTLRGNLNWMASREGGLVASIFGEEASRAALPVVPAGASDSAALDTTFELLLHAEIDAPTVKSLLMPEAWSKRTDMMSPGRRAFYHYANAVMEPWDGPAAVAAYDGRWAIAGLDRNGLRPLRWALTADNILAVGSETGMCPLDDTTIIERGAVTAGGMIGIDFAEKRFLREDALLEELAARRPYGDWLTAVRQLDDELADVAEPPSPTRADLSRAQCEAGLTREDLELILRPAVEEAREAIGSMGDDTPLAVLSDQDRPLYHYFRQNFAQVTNPPIDPLREARVMSLKTRFHTLPVLNHMAEAREILTLESPILSNGMYDALDETLHDTLGLLSIRYRLPQDPADDAEVLEAALDQLCAAAISAVRDDKKRDLVLSDEPNCMETVPIPAVLAVGAVQKALVREGLRRRCSLTVRAGDAIDSHACAVLIAVGATAVNPYLAFDSIAGMQAQGLFGAMTVKEASTRLRKALDAGLLKIMAKLGISVISSYRGGCNFEALGLSRTLCERYFTGLSSRVSGLGLKGIAARARARHQAGNRPGIVTLPIGGFYRQRVGSERHVYEAELVSALQEAARTGSQTAFDRFLATERSRPPAQLRDLLALRPLGPCLPREEVESVNPIRQRFVTPGMSLGALSPEAHGTLNIAMNRIGARSVSGEGGEDPDRYTRLANGDDANSAVKQIASGRFGVTARYLNECREIEIKVAQGAKPGEGGQLPGFKVTEYIGRMRKAKPGTPLISPPPHHDIYSIEDLAQLVYDLKQINPDAEVCVKLVAGAGIGTIAAGVAKAKADVILISGHVGGTGASPQTSIKFAGLPWEMGLAEVQQILVLNGLRGQVTLRADGGIRTGRDIVIAAMLGAEQFGIGTASLVAMGCLMVRQCHSNTCPVGICTQDEALRKKFPGNPDHVINLMTLLAEDVRRELSLIGARTLDEVIGRSDLLQQVARGGAHLDDLDLSPLLIRPEPGASAVRRTIKGRNPVPASLDETILKDVQPVFDRSEKMQVQYGVRNTHRAVGTRLSSDIVRRFGETGLPAGRLTLRLNGSAGQSLGAFGVQGLRIELIGDANDYVGKGLSGAEIVVAPSGRVGGTIIGNTCLYGATSGALFAAGKAGERFGVRNSGAIAVIEGCGANGCEYMTGGSVLVLGPIGDNFAAGMTGGEAFLFDFAGEAAGFLNTESIRASALDGEAARTCHALITRHHEATRSGLAKAILADWEEMRQRFLMIRPKAHVREEPKLPKRRSG
jgi:glutamate synthase (NADPH) large chain